MCSGMLNSLTSFVWQFLHLEDHDNSLKMLSSLTPFVSKSVTPSKCIPFFRPLGGSLH